MDAKRSMAWVIGILCLLAVCDSRAAYGAPPSDPCSLLTPAQVSAVLGMQVGAGKSLVSTVCDWRAPNQPAGKKEKAVTITLLDANGFAATKMQLNLRGITKTPVSGIGDEAVYGASGLASTLSVKKGNFYFVVQVDGFPFNKAKGADETEAKEKTLALEILSKV